MAYADQQMSGNRATAFVVVAVLHVVLGYLLISGLAYEGFKEVVKRVTTIDVKKEEKKEEPPPPPPKKIAPPPIVAPPPKINVAVAPPPVPRSRYRGSPCLPPHRLAARATSPVWGRIYDEGSAQSILQNRPAQFLDAEAFLR